jgi:hypothetical protein
VIAAAFGREVFFPPAPIDDPAAIFYNPRLSPEDHPPRFTSDEILWYWKNTDPTLYIPLYYTFLGLLAKATYVPTPDARGLRLDPRVFHAASVLLHAVNVLLVFALLRRLLRKDWPAAAGALFYGLHPLVVETVAWTVGLRDLFSVFWTLICVLLYLRAVEVTSRRARVLYYVAGLLCVPVGMMFKPTVAVASLIAASIDWLILRRPARKVAAATIPFLIAAAPLLIVTRHLQSSESAQSVAWPNRPALAGASLAFYAAKVVLPVRLTFDYGWRPVPMLAKPWFRPIGVATCVIVVLVIWLTRRRWRWAAAALAVFFFGLLPTLGLIPFTYQLFSTVADHYAIVALLGPALLVGWLVRAPTALKAGIWTGIMIALMTLTEINLGYWREGFTLARHGLAVNPHSMMLHDVLGNLDVQHGNYAAAEREFLSACEEPDFTIPRLNLARLYAREGRGQAAIEAFHGALLAAERSPPSARPHLEMFLFGVLAPLTPESARRTDWPLYVAEQRKLFGTSVTGPAGSPLQK